jgi:glycosyltransferase involved in cell wall biosynthesis
MLISVIIPHLNQEEHLRTGLRALHAQEQVTAEVEIIVVDNGSRRLPTEICAEWPNVRLIAEPEPGPGPARNRGAAEAEGDILAFIDADCRAHPGWLSAIESTFADPEVEIIGGDVRVRYEDPGRPTFLEPYEAIYSYRNEKYIAEGYSGTGNLAVRPDVLGRVGPFAGINVAEDTDWGLRAGALGYRILYVPEMIVYHPARSSFAELARKWDRHVAHHYERYVSRRFGDALWLGRALLVAVSPLFEIPTVVRSPRVAAPRERWLAFFCLTRVRFYRRRAMLRVVLRSDARKISANWNRE